VMLAIYFLQIFVVGSLRRLAQQIAAVTVGPLLFG